MLGGYNYRQAVKVDLATWQAMMQNAGTTTTGSLGAVLAQQPAPPAQKRKASNLDWLDKRVNEMRVRL